MKKFLVVVLTAALALTAVMAAALVPDGFEGDGFACDGVRVREGDDLDAVINGAPSGATFCVEAGDYPISETVRVRNGDVVRGEPGETTRRGPAVDPDPVVHVRNAAGLARMFDVAGRGGRLEWLDIHGSPDGARYTEDTRATCDNWGGASNRCPDGGTGVAIAGGRSGPAFVLEHLQIHHNPAQCLSGLKGSLLRTELHHCSQNADYWGYTAGALKTINEMEAARNFVHDNEAVGLWCDQGCRDNPASPEGWHQHDNLVVDNGRAGVRYEFAPQRGNGARSSQPTALIEDNRLAGNNWGGVDVHDAQNATVRDNLFGPMTVAGMRYPHNGSGREAMQFSESADPRARTDLWNAEAYGNRLNGETADGCERFANPDKLRCGTRP